MGARKTKNQPLSPEGFRGYVRTILNVLVVVDRLFGVDTRSLALLRVGLASVLLAELVVRARHVSAFYTDQGIMPRAFLTENVQNPWSFSLHLASGSAFFQAFLFFCALLAATALLVGYKTRLAAFLSWLLLISLFVRNPEVQSSGDILMSLLLFWGMFLPLGLRWSIDRARATNGERLPQRVLSMATAAVLIQAALVYFFAWWLKSGQPWHDGSAVWIALNWDQGTTAFGRSMLQFPAVLSFATHSILWFELIGPLLLFMPFYTSLIRLVVVLMFVLLHLSFVAMMTLATFPFVSIVSVIPFLPTRFWELFKVSSGAGITIFYDGGCSFCKRMVRLIQAFFILPRAATLPAYEDPTAEKIMLRHNSWVVRDKEGEHHTAATAMRVLLRASPVLFPFHYLLYFQPLKNIADKTYVWIANHRPAASRATEWLAPEPLRWKLPFIRQFAVGALLIYVLIWNLAGVLNFAAPLQGVARFLQIHQHWAMFAPIPKLDDGWFVVPAVLKNGEEIDVFRAVISEAGENISWEKPEPVWATFPNVQWRKYLENLVASKDPGRYRNLAVYLYRTWNVEQPPERHLVRLDIYYMLEHTYRLDAPPEQIHLWEHRFSE